MSDATSNTGRNRTEIAGQLRAERLRRGLSQEGMARKLGLKKATYVSYEYGRSEPPLAIVARACDVLGLRPGALLGVARDRKQRTHLIGYEVERRLDDREREADEVLQRLAEGETVDRSEAEIEGLLRELFSENLVRITDLAMDPDLGTAVAERLGLNEVRVVKMPRAMNSPFLRAILVAEAAKKAFIEKLQPNFRIGITGGFLITRMLDSLSRRELRDVPPFEIFPIAVSPFERLSVSPNTILGHLYYRNFERSLRAHGLMFVTPESQKDLRETMRVLDGATGSDLVFLGLGDFDLRQRLADSKEADTMRSLLYARGFNFQRIVEEEKAVGDIMFFPVDATGTPVLLDELQDLICSVGLETLHKLASFYRVPVVAVVSGARKRDIVVAACRGRYINAAVMETDLAEALLEG
jgi:DNA-binding transcriptional regulator LsrR (DeoR family)/DNA-binding XRE family transcriptional regulator